MFRRTSISAVALFCGLVLAAVELRAERAPEDRQQATHVVAGKVEGVYVRRDERTMYYLVEIAIDKVEKGSGLKAGETLYVGCYLWDADWFKGKKLSTKQQKQLSREGPAYDGVPKEGDQVTVYANRSGSKYVGIFPNWFDVREK